MDEKAADKEKRRQPKPERKEDTDGPEIPPEPAVIPPHYALENFSRVKGNQIFTQKKGDIIKDQQRLNFYKQHDAPIASFDESQTAKCPNPKCGCVFAWDGGLKQEA